MKANDLIRKCKNRAHETIGAFVRKHWRSKLDGWKIKKKEADGGITIFANNCTGGILYRDMNHIFQSPTIGMFVERNDLIKFLKRPQWYIDQEPQFVKRDDSIPAAILGGDVHLLFQHYKSEQHALERWNERKKRINWDNVYIVACEKLKDYQWTDDDFREFDNLPYEHKIVFTSKPMPEIKSSVWAKDFPDGADARIIGFCNIFGKRYYSKYFNPIKWFSERNDGLK